MNPSAGILGVALGKSSDHPGEAAVIVYADENMQAAVPATVDGVRTLVIPTNLRCSGFRGGAAIRLNTIAVHRDWQPRVLNQAVAIKRQIARGLMQQNPAFFGVGVGQSLDNPQEAALVIYVDRKRFPPNCPRPWTACAPATW